MYVILFVIKANFKICDENTVIFRRFQKHGDCCTFFKKNHLYYLFNLKYLKHYYKMGVVAHVINPSTQKAEAGRSLSSRTAWSIEQVPGQPGLHRETVSKKKKLA